MDERRRTPRQLAQGQSVGLPVAESVRVLDMSSVGVLLETSFPPDLGARARLRLSLAGEPLAAEIEVRRVAPGPEGYRVGARFVDMTPAHRRLIERFMSQ
jgi:c-di-GMP-binding flagellar brake protein YcgR